MHQRFLCLRSAGEEKTTIKVAIDGFDKTDGEHSMAFTSILLVRREINVRMLEDTTTREEHHMALPLLPKGDFNQKISRLLYVESLHFYAEHR